MRRSGISIDLERASRRLSAGERRQATALYRALSAARDLFQAGGRDVEKLKNKMRAVLREEGTIEVDYAEVADPDTLELLTETKNRMVLLVAARLGRTRLIDNLLVL